MAGIVLTACATGEREDGPAPVLQVTPREPVVAEAEPPVVPAPAQPVAPKKQQTRVFAYRDPAAEPDPEPTPEPTAAADAVRGAAPQAASAASAPAKAAPAAPSVAQTPAKPAPSPAAKPAPAPAQPTTQAKVAAPVPAAVAAKPPAPAAPTPKVAQTPPQPESKPPQDAVPVAPKPPAPPAEPPAPTAQVVAVPPAPPLAAPGLPPAADALARQAEQQRQSGDYAGAAASLERSLRIAPREAYLWNRLARVRLEQGQAAQAGNLASRSNDLAGDTPNVKQDNWRVIAESKRRAGDIAGATEAEKRASGN
jgi:tetratricopeptide (TPR) repeat protein